MRPLSKPLTALTIILLALAFVFWVTRQISLLTDGLPQLKYIFLLLVVGATIALIALWWRGALGQVRGLLANPIAVGIAKVLGITAGLMLVAFIGYALVTTDAGDYKNFILNRNFVLWVVVLPIIASAVLMIYSPIGIPAEYRQMIPAGLKKLALTALLLVGVLIYFFPEDDFSKSVFSEAKRAASLINDRVIEPIFGRRTGVGKQTAAKPDKSKKPDKPRVVHRVYVESPKTVWIPYTGSQQDIDWYRWAAHSLENREACRVSDPCQKAMWRLREYGCLAPDYRLLERCGG